MAFEWKYFLDVATHLHQLEKDGLDKEACCRIAISRAYFAVFCHARNYARDRQHLIPEYSDKDHYKVLEHFKRSKFKGVASRLHQLRMWRNEADYADDIGELGSQTEVILKAATEAMGYLK